MRRLAVVLFLGLLLGACDRPAPSTPPARTVPPDIADGLRTDTIGLVEGVATDGSPMVDLQGRFQHVPVAYRNPDGTITIGCANNPRQVQRMLSGQPLGRPATRPREFK